jgi:hypothetical protein
MGTEWYIIDDEKREYYDLGKGPWRQNNKGIPLTGTKADILKFITDGWDHLIKKTVQMKNGSPAERKEAKESICIEYCIWLRDNICSFMEGRNKKKLRLVTDSGSYDERYGTVTDEEEVEIGSDAYKEVGSRYTSAADARKYVRETYGPGQSVMWEIFNS